MKPFLSGQTLFLSAVLIVSVVNCVMLFSKDDVEVTRVSDLCTGAGITSCTKHIQLASMSIWYSLSPFS